MLEQDPAVQALVQAAVLAERARCAAIAGAMRDGMVAAGEKPVAVGTAEAIRSSILHAADADLPAGPQPTADMVLAAHRAYVVTRSDSPGRMQAAIAAAMALAPRRPAPDDLEDATGPQVMCDGRGRPVAVVEEDGTRWNLTKA